MKEFIRLKIVLPLIALLMVLTAIIIPLAGYMNHTNAQGLQNLAHAVINPIVVENKKKGTTAWQSPQLARYAQSQINLDKDSRTSQGTKTNIKLMASASAWTDSSIRGYANTTSINHGDSINFYVGTTQASY